MIRLLAGSMILPLMLGGVLTNAATPTDRPTTAPAAEQVAVDVAVEPFTRLGDSAGAPAWIGTAVQQNLLSDLSRMHFRTLASDATQPAAQPAATYLVRGSYQISGDVIRFDGQLVQSSGGQAVGGITATGPLRDLFGLEDAVSAQAIHQLRRATSPADAIAPMTPEALASTVQPPSAAPTAIDGYDGSVLQAYVNSNTAPSNDYADQENASRVRQTYASDYSTGLSPYGGFGYGGFGYGGFGYGGLGYGTFSGTSFIPYGAGFGSFGRFGGYSGYGGRYGSSGLGRGSAFGYGGNYGYGFGGGAGVGGHGGGFAR